MTTLAVRHRVADYDIWKAAFDDHRTNREQHGCTGHRVLRDAEDDHEVTVVTFWRSADNARAFASDPSLREVMERAKVDGPPRLEFYDDVEEVSYGG